MTKPIIQTPRGSIIVTKAGKARLQFNADFQSKHQSRFSAAQKFMDSEILRLSEPYTPLDTSMLIKSGTLGTDVGSGIVMWIAPYSKAQYYSPREPGSQTGPLRGPFWFERMKEVSGRTLMAGARKLAARKS